MKGVWSFKTAAVAAMLALAAWPAAISMTGVAAAAGPAKATGSGYWTNSGDLSFYAEFNAHVANGVQPAKGYLLQELVDGTGGFTVDVDTVYVYDTYACFGGTTDSAWGTYASHLSQYRWTAVVDGGEPGIGVDALRGNWQSSRPVWCSSTSVNTASNWFTGGNVQVHFGG